MSKGGWEERGGMPADEMFAFLTYKACTLGMHGQMSGGEAQDHCGKSLLLEICWEEVVDIKFFSARIKSKH